MNKVISIEIPYPQDSSLLFAKLRDLPWAIYLDSCHPYAKGGRYDIISACPFMTVITKGASTIIQSQLKQKISKADPILIIKQILDSYPPLTSSFPFTGGGIGYFAYDLAYRLKNIARLPNKQARKHEAFPDLAIGIYDWAIVVDHDLRCCHLVSANRYEHTTLLLSKVKQRLESNAIKYLNDFKLTSSWESNITKQQYASAFKKIKSHLRRGDCYQINFTQRFSASYQGSIWNAYLSLRHINPVPFAAYINFEETTIMSLSPEQFLQVKQKQATTAPIKGTKPRGRDNNEDKKLARELLASSKERAENLMIVDLLRNDFAKVCIPGTVTVPRLFHLESFANIHHLISIVKGEIAANYHSLDLLRCCFPGGSITGAPKYKAMQIIESLETYQRAIYCGAIGYIDFNGNLDTNIAIRTLLCDKHKKQIYCPAGGGIVADSKLNSEYQETCIKVAQLLKTLASK